MQEKFNSSRIKAVIGLGNPGEDYENTYHNAGFLAADYLAKNPPTSNFKILIFKPDVYMNESGRAVAGTVKMKNIRPEETLVIHDDSDLNLGKFKFSFGSGSAGHKGVQSVFDALKTKNFWRLRIGIRPTVFMGLIGRRKKAGLPRRVKAGDFVLKKISAKDKKILEKVFKSALTHFY